MAGEILWEHGYHGTRAAEVEVPTSPQPTQPTTTPLAVLADHERGRPTEVRSTNPFTTSVTWSSTGPSQDATAARSQWRRTVNIHQ